MRKLVQKSVRNQNLRVARSLKATPSRSQGTAEAASIVDSEAARTVTVEDLSNWTVAPTTKRRPIGFVTDDQAG
ncbi:MAG: hypothetical protein HUU30_09000 [Burkholderiaceae bacterium]|nr:hypothetical protein [Burkholderiaceae bacterium]